MSGQKINPLIDEMDNWDKDKRFMAASDLTQEVLTCGSGIDAHHQKQICTAFLKQIEDASVDVQGNAVKCLGKIVPFFQDLQISEVVAKLSQLVVDGKPEVRDIYATCLKGLFAELNPSCGPLVCQNVYPKMHAGICGNLEADVKEVCIDVLQDLLRRFGEPRTVRTDDGTLPSALRAFLSHDFKLSMRKRSMVALAVLAAVGSERQLDHLLNALLQDVRDKADKPERQTYLQCIGTIARHVGYRMGPHLQQVAPLLLQICRTATQDVSMDDKDDSEVEVVENALSALESFVSRCSDEIGPHVGAMAELLSSLLSFDPNVYTDDAQDDGDDDFEEEFDDDGIDSEDDDNSWKVRRSSLKVLSAMVKHLPQSQELLLGSFLPQIADRLKEREENVRLEVFHTFADLVRASAAYDSGASVERVFASAMPTLQKHVRPTAGKTRAGAFALLRVIAEFTPQFLEPQLGKLLPDMLRALEDRNSSIRLEVLHIFFELTTRYKDASVYQSIAPQVIPTWKKTLTDSYYKIAGQSFRLFGAFLKPLRPDPSQPFQFAPLVETIIPAVQSQLVQTDVDQDVKEATLECFGKLCAHVGDHPSLQPALQSCLDPFVERFRNEVTRSAAVKALKTICTTPTVPLGQHVGAICGLLTEFLKQQARPFRHLCLDAMVVLHIAHGKEVGVDVHTATVRQVSSLISADDLFVTDLCIQAVVSALDACPQLCQAVLQDVYPRILVLCRSPLLQHHALETIVVLLGKLAVVPQFEERAFADLTDFSGLGTQARTIVSNLAKALAAVVLAAPAFQKTAVERFLSTLHSPASDESLAHEHAILTLGEVGKFLDLSAVANIGQVFVEQLHTEADEVRTAAAVSLGYASMGCINFLAIVTSTLSQGVFPGDSRPCTPKHRYLLLISLREFISLCRARTPQLAPHLATLLQIFVSCADSDEEGVRNLVSECIGLLLPMDPCVAAALQPLFGSAHLQPRAAAAASLRFAANNRCSAATISPLLPQLLVCLRDGEHVVRKAAVVSINAMCLNCREVLRPHAAEVLQAVFQNCEVVKALVREVDLGPFKHKVDDGRPLRKVSYAAVSALMAAFNFLATAQVVDLVITGLTDDEDVQAAACQVLVELSTASPSSVLARMGDLADPFDRAVGKCIKQQQKQPGPKSEDCLRLYVRTLVAVNNISEQDPRNPLGETMARWMKDAAFSAVATQIGRDQ